MNNCKVRPLRNAKDCLDIFIISIRYVRQYFPLHDKFKNRERMEMQSIFMILFKELWTVCFGTEALWKLVASNLYGNKDLPKASLSICYTTKFSLLCVGMTGQCM